MAPLLSEEESAVDPYATLGLEMTAAEGDIKKAYRKLSLKYHPDKNSTPEGAVMFRKISVALGILSDTAKKGYIDGRLESDRKKAARYAEMKGKQKEMIDALHAREEEARLAKIQLAKRKREETEEESIKEAGRRMLEEAQKRAAAAAAAVQAQQERRNHPSGSNGSNVSNGSTSKMPNISPADLSLLITIPSSIPTENLQSRIISLYGPLAHFILKPPPKDDAGGAEGGKGKKKMWKAIVEFEKGNWGGCWACWKDHQKGSLGGSGGLGVGVKAKWVGGEEPAWVEWAKRAGIESASNGQGSAENGKDSIPRDGAHPQHTQPPLATSNTTPHPFANLSAAPSFSSAPDFGGTTMADLLSSHQESNRQRQEEKRKADEFESMTLFQMRQKERERLEAQIRAEEGD